jgi:hypothetical protein
MASPLMPSPSFLIGTRRATSIAEECAAKAVLPGPGQYKMYRASMNDVKFGTASREGPVPLTPSNAPRPRSSCGA